MVLIRLFFPECVLRYQLGNINCQPAFPIAFDKAESKVVGRGEAAHVIEC